MKIGGSISMSWMPIEVGILEEESMHYEQHKIRPLDLPSVNAFGKPLEELMELQKDMVDLEVPLILVALTQAIIDLEGARKEGLFRYFPPDSRGVF